jgi:tRNA-guanine family transglycosylase
VGLSSRHLKFSDGAKIAVPLVWLGQSVRTTVVTTRYPELGRECWMVSLGDVVHRPQLAERVFCGDLRTRLGVCGPLMLDSGGFTMMMQHRTLEVCEIADIYKRAKVELCISLDIPPTSKDNSRIRIRKYDKTQKNLAHLIEVVGPDKLVPVIHGVNETEVSENCRRTLEILPRPTFVCVGGLVPLLRRSGHDSIEQNRGIAWLQKLIAMVRAYFPTAIIHVLGAGSPKNITAAIQCGADSTDSLAWRRAAGFGTIYLPGTSERFLGSRNRKRATSRPTLKREEIELLAACACPACSEYSQIDNRIAELSKSYIARAAHNASVILHEAKRAFLLHDNRM